MKMGHLVGVQDILSMLLFFKVSRESQGCKKYTLDIHMFRLDENYIQWEQSKEPTLTQSGGLRCIQLAARLNTIQEYTWICS